MTKQSAGPRRRARLEVEVSGSAAGSFVAYTRDFGAGGLFLMTSQRPAIDAPVVVTLLEHQLSVCARARYYTDDGVGFEFIQVTPLLHTRLLQLLYVLDLNGAPSVDRRRAHRLPITVSVCWEFEGAKHVGHITNVSIYGALLLARHTLAADCIVTLRRHEGSLAACQARVVRSEEGAVGLTFVDDSAAFLATLTDL